MTAMPKWWVIGNVLVNSDRVTRVTFNGDNVKLLYSDDPGANTDTFSGKDVVEGIKQLVDHHRGDFHVIKPIP